MQIAALLVAVPLAIAAHSWETAIEWWGAQDLFATQVPPGEAANYAGARWRLEKLSKIATQPDGSAIVLAELEATVTDKEKFLLLPCSVALTGPNLPRWVPVFMRPSQLRKARPDLAERPTCSTAKVGKIEQDSVVQMIETFKLPWQEFERVSLELSLPPERPTYLVFQR